MKSRILVIAAVGFFATFVACSGERVTESTTATASLSTEASPTVDATVTTESTDSMQTDIADQAADAGEQITEGAKMIGEGLKEEARQAMAVGGAALEQAGQSMQDKAEAAAPEDDVIVNTPAETVVAGDVASGASVFKGKCVSCHGADASGNTPIGKKNNVPDLRSSEVQDLTDVELATMIANGKSGTVSAGAHKSKALTAKQIEDVIAYLRSVRT